MVRLRAMGGWRGRTVRPRLAAKIGCDAGARKRKVRTTCPARSPLARDAHCRVVPTLPPNTTRAGNAVTIRVAGRGGCRAFAMAGSGKL